MPFTRASEPELTHRRSHRWSKCAAMLIACALVAGGAAAAPQVEEDRDAERAEGSFLLVTRDFQVRPVRLAAINDQSLVMMESDRGWVTLDLAQCVALISAQAESDARPARGMLMLADGQRLPGEAVVAANAPSKPDTLAWNHPWLGRVDVPFQLISSVLLTDDAVAPPQGAADVVLTVNGDRQEGFITAIGDPVTIEVTPASAADGPPATPQTISIPLDRVVAITMVAPRQPGVGRRMWFVEGTVLDVQSVAVGDDGYVRMSGGALLASAATGSEGGGSGEPGGNRRPARQAPRVGIDDIAAILFDRDALVPLAGIAPTRIEGPATRYVLPKPAIIDPDAALGLSTIEFSGPVVVRYALPAGSRRFIAEVELPREMREWGDCDLIVRVGDEQVFRAHLAAQTPTASINVALPAKGGGRELTIEVAPGAHGPIQDLVRLHRPMLLKGK